MHPLHSFYPSFQANISHLSWKEVSGATIKNSFARCSVIVQPAKSDKHEECTSLLLTDFDKVIIWNADEMKMKMKMKIRK